MPNCNALGAARAVLKYVVTHPSEFWRNVARKDEYKITFQRIKILIETLGIHTCSALQVLNAMYAVAHEFGLVIAEHHTSNGGYIILKPLLNPRNIGRKDIEEIRRIVDEAILRVLRAKAQADGDGDGVDGAVEVCTDDIRNEVATAVNGVPAYTIHRLIGLEIKRLARQGVINLRGVQTRGKVTRYTIEPNDV